MGYYLNSTQVLSLYKSEYDSPYFVDKSMLLKELFPLVKSGNKHICITRPRRFVLAGIGYSKKTKEHRCKVEVVR